MLAGLSIDKSWTLFLDRDGVINEQRPHDYVKTISEFHFVEGVLESIAYFNNQFGKIVIVTNQQGISRGIMTEDDLHAIHGYMKNMIEMNAGRIDKIYFAPQLSKENHYYRKPGVGMGLHAKRDFPEIEFNKSVIVGDSETDIEFGMNLGMKTVMLRKGRNISSKADYIFENLYEFYQALK